MTSTLTIYKINIPNFSYESNKIIEGFEDYALTEPNYFEVLYTSDTFQYFKFETLTSIKINYSQYLQDYVNNTNLLYVRIKNNEENSIPFYFFVRKATPLSQATIKLDLRCDSINTYTKENSTFTISSKTKINREHSDRFYQTPISSNTYARKISPLSENISPLLYKKNDNKIEYPILYPYNCNWYLAYATSLELDSSDRNPMTCIIVNELDSTQYPSSKAITDLRDVDDLSYPYYYIITYRNNVGGKFYYLNNGTQSSLNLYDGTTTPSGVFYIVIYSNGTQVIVKDYTTSTLNNKLELYDVGEIDGFYLSNSSDGVNTQIYMLSKSVQLPQKVDNNEFYGWLQRNAVLIDTTINEKIGVNKIDKASSNLVKIIKLPYPPFDFSVSSGVINISNASDFKDKIGTIEAIPSTEFESSLSIAPTNYASLQNNLFKTITPTLTQARDTANESQMFHSDLYQLKFYYDSFGKVIPLESIQSDGMTMSTNVIKFKPSNTCNSRFCFYFETFDTYAYLKNEDFAGYLTLARNNEELIYNNNYVNYLRSGYNFDVKTKNRQEAINWIKTGASLIGSIASFALSGATGGASILAGIGLGLSTITSLASTIVATQNANDSLSNKINQLQQQATSVSNADDVNLMQYYCGNRLHSSIYEPSTEMKSLLNDFFYYFGIVKNYYGVPNTDSRVWFNFLSCELKFASIKNIPQDAIDDIVSKYNEGVTFMHYNQSLDEFDFNQVRENYEIWFFN